jgi:hypothetical protein
MFDDTILFVMFQGGGASEFAWDEGPSKFLDKLKKIGRVYTFQNKVYNTLYYNLSNKNRKLYNNDINFDINYLNMDYYINMVFNDIKHKYDLNKIKLIPCGWSAGGFFTIAFSQKYYKYCKFQILLDSVMITKECINIRINDLKSDLKYSNFNNNDLQILQKKIMTENNIKDIQKLLYISHLSWTLDIAKNISYKFKIPTLSFYDLESIENKDNSFLDFNNKLKLTEVAFLTKQNSKEYYKNIFYIDKGHFLFGDKNIAIDIINNIKLFL